MMVFVYSVAATLADLLIKVTPYFLLGVLFAGLLKVYVKPAWTERFFTRGTSSVFYASLAGALLPGCSCATMPMSDGVKAQSGHLGTVTAFIIISPLLSPITIVLTYAMLSGKMTVARIVVPFLFSMSVGMLLNILEAARVKGFSFPAVVALDPSPQNCSGENSCSSNPFRPTLWGSLRQVLRELGPYFLIGMALAAVLTTLIPEEAIPRYIGGSGPLAYLLASFIGIPVYVCEGEEVPLTYALLQLGLGPGPAFTFLLGSVGTCIPTLFMARKIIGTPATALYLAAWFFFAIAGGWAVSLMF